MTVRSLLITLSWELTPSIKSGLRRGFKATTVASWALAVGAQDSPMSGWEIAVTIVVVALVGFIVLIWIGQRGDNHS